VSDTPSNDDKETREEQDQEHDCYPSALVRVVGRSTHWIDSLRISAIATNIERARYVKGESAPERESAMMHAARWRRDGYITSKDSLDLITANTTGLQSKKCIYISKTSSYISLNVS
jgi:hypothetical protein